MKGEVNVDVLLTCWLCKNIPIWKCITLGDLLRVFYHHGIFRQPKTVGSPEDLRFLLEQILELATCALLMNDIYALHDVAMYDEISGRDWIRKKLKGILSRRRSIQEKHALKGAEGDTIRVDDLDVRSLKEIGRLEIRWTVFLEDHLKLDLQNKILSVVYDQPEVAGLGPMARWQHLQIQDLPATFLDRFGRPGETIPSPLAWKIDLEITQPWAILFRVSRNGKKRSIIHDQYAPLKYMPETLRRYLRDKHIGREINSDGFYYVAEARPTSLEVVYEHIVESSANKEPLLYSQFPLFETRLRQLRHYMDSQKPRGLRQLWKDNRDSLNYYTFWGVIIFGVLSVVLAMFSLAVSVAQTVAAFRSLNGTPTTSG
ncbi:hypothetical protein L207DRAFT_588921 [Hyaloscypha variabilis F]|uniref:Uncharacterized protein n=1 Tax=Hyaloscypha variabilis (strain UAMH 11265 / GT02V1 / F) TaxID=1149755 RepID=A0A2J6R736_HYAVF|nr:hypothetical protein L207DRAFT_588921 [Hyaloscypha variabilis F]